MGVLRVVLGTPGPLPDRVETSTTRVLLTRWFLRVAKVAHALRTGASTPGLGVPFTGVKVEYASGWVELGAKDVLVYLVPDRDHSVLRLAIPGFPSDAMGEAGTTFHVAGGRACSEVYLDEAVWGGPRAVAALAFHEAMHNRTRRGNGGPTGLHNRDGVALGGFPVRVDDEPSYEDVRLLAAALVAEDVRQYTAGFELYKGAFG